MTTETPPPAAPPPGAERLPTGSRRRAEGPGLVRRLVPWFLGLGALAALAAVFVPSFLETGVSLPTLDVSGRVAILPVANDGSQNDTWVRWGLPMVLVDTLEATAGVRTIGVRRLHGILSERGLDADDAAARHRAAEIAIAAGADLVVDARFQRLGDGTALAYRIIDPAGTVTAEGELRDTTALGLAGSLALALADPLAGGVAPVPLGRALSGDPFLDRLYAEGVHRALSDGGGGVLQAYFEIALHGAPDFLHARAAMIEILRFQGRLRRARGMAEELLRDAQSRGSAVLQANTFRTLGLLAALDGDNAAAYEQYRQAYRLEGQRRDRLRQAAALEEQARVALAIDRRDEALKLFSQVLQLRRGEGDRLGEIDVLLRLGSLMLSDANLDAATETLAEARDDARQIGDAWAEHRVAVSQGEVAWRREDPVAAAEHWQAALAFYRQRGDRRRVLYLSRDLARATHRLGDFTAAEELYADQLEAAQALEDERLVAEACLRLAELELRQGYAFQAEDHVRCAIEGDRHIENRSDLQRVIAWLAYEQGNFQLAVETFTRLRRQSTDLWTAEDEAIFG
ncbi:MAG: hypothetical protein AAGE94_20005, partial [Acidobacteriota bacterium]